MQKFKSKIFLVLLSLMVQAAWCMADAPISIEDHHPIQVKEGNVQGAPKGSTIQASINGHMLVVVFTENLGQVAVEVTTASGGTVQTFNTPTPNGMQLYIPFTGNYIVTFTLPNGDEYYGEFTVTD